MLKRKNATKILLVALSLILLIAMLSGCSDNTAVSRDKDTLDKWANADGSYEENTITFESDLGFVDTILLYLGKFLNLITKIMPANSYILALFIFGIIIEIILVPFSIVQQRNSRKQALLKPKEMAIRKRYAGRNDQATQKKLQEEVQELYQKENVNPMSGCLPMLIQLPIIMSLYYIVINPIKYVFGWGGNFVHFVSAYMKTELGISVAQNGTIGFMSRVKEVIQTKGIEAFEGIKNYCANGDEVYAKIGELANQTESINLNIGPLNMGYVPSFKPEEKILWLLLLVPVLTFVFQFFTSKLTRKFTYQSPQAQDQAQAGGCSPKMLDWLMPAMSTWIAFAVPAAVGVYWMFKGVIGTLKQFIISKVMPMPQFTEEDYKAAEREYAGKHPKKVQKSENAGKVRSLHHIDDEDYDENGNYIGEPSLKADDSIIEVIPEAPEENGETKATEQKLPENSLRSGASLKDESDKAKKPDKKKKKKNDQES